MVSFFILLVVLMGVNAFCGISEKDAAREPVWRSTEKVSNTEVPTTAVFRAKIQPITRSSTMPSKATETAPDPHPAFRNLALLGTVSGDSLAAFAVIAERDVQTQKLYRLGDSILDGVIVDISKDKVIIRRNGKDQILTMQNQGAYQGAMQPDGTGLKNQDIQRKKGSFGIPGGSSEMMEIASPVRVRSCVFEGGTSGLELVAIKPGSLIEKMGVKTGDIIEEIDGKPITKPDEMIFAYEQAQSALPSFFSEGKRVDSGEILRLMDLKTVSATPEIISLVRKVSTGEDISLGINRMGNKLTMTYRFR